ncbi:hypothetical protein [Streptomyces melanosporofaciens]|uniref:Secreted protein n=1 Tax=Streptomyces melanosporofaciens TaxID=67327 RepID=A0A1H4QJQ0_STRMJ|nr:hypothetical protein [Streptomyces melanosporofaciens]SEC19789.1 hypothetical protein SAMN04490356_3263 [Streptomyces melanosporofaciens]
MRYASSRTTGRRGTALASSAAALCLGALLSGCGAGGDGYVAAGAAGPDGRRSAQAVPPKGGVDLVPLDEDGTGNDRDGKGGRGGKRDQGASGPTTTGDGRADGAASRAPSASARAPGRTDGPGGGKGGSGAPGHTDDDPKGDDGPKGGGPGKPSASGPGSDPSDPSDSPTPTGPAALEVGKPERTATDERWCEKVKVEFRNTGGSAVASGTVTFSTHVIDLLGIDWATLKSEEELPAPIGAGQKKEKTWTVCVDDWRVPLGMHIETKDVSVAWKP